VPVAVGARVEQRRFGVEQILDEREGVKAGASPQAAQTAQFRILGSAGGLSGWCAAAYSES